MSVSDEIYEQFFSKAVVDDVVPKPIIEQIKDYYVRGENPRQEVIINLINGDDKDVHQD